MPTSPAAGPGEDPGESSAGEGSAGLDEDVLEMVRRQLDRDSPPSTTALYGRAVQINRDIYDLTLRQFHAKYPLRVKREKARREREAGDPSSSGPTSGDEGARAGSRGTGAEGPGAPGRTDATVDEDAGRRHLFGPDADPDGEGGDPRRSGTEIGRDGSGPSGADASTRRPDGGQQGQGAGSAPRADEETRERVRRVFMRFAREVAEAERPEVLVGVVERIPDRVDEIARIVRPRPSEP